MITKDSDWISVITEVRIEIRSMHAVADLLRERTIPLCLVLKIFSLEFWLHTLFVRKKVRSQLLQIILLGLQLSGRRRHPQEEGK